MNIRTLIDGQPEKNDVQNGIFPFRVNVYTYLTPQKIIASHYHKIIEILVVRSGSLLCICNGRTLRARKTTSCFSTPMTPTSRKRRIMPTMTAFFWTRTFLSARIFPRSTRLFSPCPTIRSSFRI